jgi:RimJ/RimL family protein N-acetyltransferase
MNTDLNRLEIVAAVENIPSQRVAEKAGAIREGIARSRLFLNGRFHDAAVFSFARGS